MFDSHTVLWRSPDGSEGIESYQSKERAIGGAQTLLKLGYTVHRIQHGGKTILDIEAIQSLISSPQSK
jgi:hypothetical protein